ncbi:MAG: GMC family oxidoreductase N-terminal domain-containing protein [Chloroflexi bacterium]|nr:GMC family oxidoreductase N-terminal domain-containing protein [Chloroflexota bacterium]
MTHFLTDPQFETLKALCDTLLPSLDPPPGADENVAAYFKRSAADLDIARRLAATLRDYATPESQKQFRQLLDLLNAPLSAGPLTGHFRRFADLPFEAREKVLQSWAVSPIGLLRQGFQGVKRLAHSLYFSVLDENGSNPNWAAIHYPGPPPGFGASNKPKPIQPRPVTQDTTLNCDVVIVGSGAGGGVVAGVLAQAGHHVIVLEKGGYHAETDFTGREYEAFERMYEKAGNLTTEDIGLVVLAGSTLGGGATINWAASFRTPDYVLDEWETQYHLTGFTGPEFQQALDIVCAREHVDTDESQPNPQNQALFDGCQKLGYHVGPIPRNVNGCGSPPACGWCGFGCPTGAKQSVLKTWLQDAADAGAEIVTDCHADKVLTENGKAVGVAATVGKFSLTVKARIVVAAAGAIHSPALLLRSSIPNPNIGLNLRLHPTTAIRGEFESLVETWRGVMMSVYSDQLGNQDGEHYGVKIETPPAHPGLLGFALPWLSARHYKTLMSRLANQAAFIVLTRDKGSGRVTVDSSGRPRLRYHLSSLDAKHLQAGIEAGLRIAAAAGAVEIGTLHSGLPEFRPNGDSDALENYLRRVRGAGTTLNKLGLFSAHQMGTCRMGGERAYSVVDHTGQSWEAPNLFVADASAFPTSSGVNPMITIQAIAYRTAQYIKTRL